MKRKARQREVGEVAEVDLPDHLKYEPPKPITTVEQLKSTGEVLFSPKTLAGIGGVAATGTGLNVRRRGDAASRTIVGLMKATPVMYGTHAKCFGTVVCGMIDM